MDPSAAVTVGAGTEPDPIVDSPARLGEAFSDPGWLSRNELTAETVLTYFSISPFWSADCINDRRRALMLDDAQASLLIGVEYRLRDGWQSTPGLFVIERLLRKPGGSATVISLYYVLQGTVFQCPDLATLLSARVEKAADHLSRVMEAYESARRTAAAAAASAAAGPAGLPPAAMARLGGDARADAAMHFSFPA